MPLIYKAFQSQIPTKEGEYLYYPRLVKMGKPVTTQEIAQKISWATSLTVGDVHNVIQTLTEVMGDHLMNSRSVKLEGLGTFTMVSKATGTGVKTAAEVSSTQITGLRCQFTPEYTRNPGKNGITRALTQRASYVSLESLSAKLQTPPAGDGNDGNGGDTGGETGGGGGESGWQDPTA